MAINSTFTNDICSGEIHSDRYDLIIIGTIHESVKDNMVYYMAASPPDYHASRSGSALPFIDQEQAFTGSPNKGKFQLQSNKFQLNLIYPNSYMIGLGSVLVPPTLYLSFKSVNGESRYASIKISEGIPYRSLTYPSEGGCARRSPEFYNNHASLPIRNNQEEILRQSAYPITNTMPSNYWGMKPSM